MLFSGRRRVSLALQGGGAHGAFTWGVLERLLDEERLAIDAISGSSAGAMNAAVLASGWLQGGRAGAHDALERFWRQVSEAGRPARWLGAGWGGAPKAALDLLARYFSPYQFNPLNINPLRGILDDAVDFDGLRSHHALRLHIAATNVETGRGRIFTNRELTCDVLLASACLPHMHKAVEIDGAHYWDGGFTANPTLFPVVFGARSPDLIVVQIDPALADGVPHTAEQINTRLSQIMFNAPLTAEMEALELMQRMALETFGSRGRFGRRLRRLTIHVINADDAMAALPAGSKLDSGWGFLQKLREIGRDSADPWVANHFPANRSWAGQLWQAVRRRLREL